MQNVTPKQLKLIGVLIAVLIGVVVVRMQPKSKPRGSSPSTVAQQADQSRETDAAQSVTQEPAEADDEPSIIPSVSLADLWTSNPFRGMTVDPEPEPVPEPAIASTKREKSASERLLEELTGQTFDDEPDEPVIEEPRTPSAELRVSAILDNGWERRALVGNAIVSVGDELDGFEVVAIHSDRIELAAADPQPDQPSESADPE